MIRQYIGAAVRNAASSLAYRLRGGKPNRRQMERQREWIERRRAAETERAQHGLKLPALEEEFAEQKRKLFHELQGYFNSEGILEYTRRQLAGNPELTKKFEARLLFMYALNNGIITDSRKAARQFAEWLGKANVGELLSIDAFQEANPQVLLDLKKNAGSVFSLLRLGRNFEHRANQAIENIISITKGIDTRGD